MTIDVLVSAVLALAVYLLKRFAANLHRELLENVALTFVSSFLGGDGVHRR